MNYCKIFLICLIALILSACSTMHKNAKKNDYAAHAQNINPISVPPDLKYLQLKMENYYPIPKIAERAKEQKIALTEDLLLPPK